MISIEDLVDTSYAKEHSYSLQGKVKRIGKFKDYTQIFQAIKDNREELLFSCKSRTKPSFLKCIANYEFKCHGLGCKSNGAILVLEQIRNKIEIAAYVIFPNGKEVAINRDHLIARSLGGSDKIDNMRPTCSDCNRDKSLIEGKLLQVYSKMEKAKEAGLSEAFETVLIAIEKYSEANNLSHANAIIHLNQNQNRSHSIKFPELQDKIARNLGMNLKALQILALESGMEFEFQTAENKVQNRLLEKSNQESKSNPPNSFQVPLKQSWSTKNVSRVLRDIRERRPVSIGDGMVSQPNKTMLYCAKVNKIYCSNQGCPSGLRGRICIESTNRGGFSLIPQLKSGDGYVEVILLPIGDLYCATCARKR